MPDVRDENRYIHPIALYATDRYIYTLNLDMTANEINNKVSNPSIQLFDWEGHPLKRYQLDRYISSFIVDEQNGTFYGVFVEDENSIYKFQL
ncbi:MAG: BF3164 family lipoprotein [Bacteroides cellulosilyticus]